MHLIQSWVPRKTPRTRCLLGMKTKMFLWWQLILFPYWRVIILAKLTSLYATRRPKRRRLMCNVYDRVSNKSVLDLARKPSDIKKIVPWDNSSPLSEYFESVLEDEVWIKIKIDRSDGPHSTVPCSWSKSRIAHSSRLFSWLSVCRRTTWVYRSKRLRVSRNSCFRRAE